MFRFENSTTFDLVDDERKIERVMISGCPQDGSGYRITGPGWSASYTVGGFVSDKLLLWDSPFIRMLRMTSSPSGIAIEGAKTIIEEAETLIASRVLGAEASSGKVIATFDWRKYLRPQEIERLTWIQAVQGAMARLNQSLRSWLASRNIRRINDRISKGDTGIF